MTRPAVVALGGGHGLAASLGALRHLTDRLTAVVTVADDGGSSGRLRRELGVLPPGDLRMALSALCADDEWGSTWRDVLQHRFASQGELHHHSVGNLLIVALWELLGDTVEGLDWVGRLLGARGLVMKDSASELLMKAMRMVMAGQYWIGRESVSGLVETLRTQMFASSEPKFGLTPRELEIVAAVAAGYSNKEMAQRFSLSQETVKHHLTRIYNKLHVTNRLELALFAISQHLVER